MPVPVTVPDPVPARKTVRVRCSSSKAPESQRIPCGRVTPRWSVAGGEQPLVTRSIARLSSPIAIVSVGPPLSPSAPRAASPLETEVRSPPASKSH